MANVVNLTADTLRRIIHEERQKLIAEAKRHKKGNGDAAVKKHQGPPPEPKVEGGKKSSSGKQVEASRKKGMKALALEENEVDADAMAETIAKKVQHLKEMKSFERRLRTQLRLVIERKNDIEQDIADLL
jgi:hypothetical protein